LNRSFGLGKLCGLGKREYRRRALLAIGVLDVPMNVKLKRLTRPAGRVALWKLRSRVARVRRRLRPMKIVLLGTAGYHPNAHRQTACVMLPELGIVLDAGTSMFRVRDRLVTSELDIFLSHAHLDHIVGLTYLLDVLYQKTIRRVTVHAEERTIAAIENHLLAEPLFPVKLPCEYRPLAAAAQAERSGVASSRGIAIAGGGHATWFPLQHPGGSAGFRLDWPQRSMAYVTDTTADSNADYVDLIRGVDVLLHECNFRDGQENFARQTGHSYASAVAQVAKAAGVGRLVLLHFNPLETSDDPVGLPAIQAIFPATTLGHDEMEIEF
jgi:ribonuclease Z